MSSAIRVMIAEDHAVVRLGLHAILSGAPDIEVVGESADGIGAVDRAQALRPDVLLLDLAMPGLQGIQVIEGLAATAPDVRVLVLTMFGDEGHVFSALRAGARGYLLKGVGPDELIRAIRDVAAGKAALDPATANLVLRHAMRTPSTPAQKELTQRERQVLALVTQGLSNKAVARSLSLSEPTVRAYVSAILAKLHLESRTQAALYALRHGLVCDDDERPLS